MKYELVIVVDLPLAEFIQKFDSEENMVHWQPGLQSVEHLTGTRGKAGAKTKLIYQMKQRRVEMIETIIENKFPDEFHSSYETSGVLNIQNNYFEEISAGRTRWRSVSEFKFNIIFKIMFFFMPGMFKKQSYAYMRHFKDFAEKGISCQKS